MTSSNAPASPPADDTLAPLDPWLWRVVYADGTLLDEEGDPDASDGRRGWAQVEEVATARQTTLSAVLLIPTRPDLPTHVIGAQATTPSDPGAAKVRVFRRRSITISAETGQEVTGARPDPVTCVGHAWANGRALYTFFFTDGSVVVSPDLNAV